MHSSETTEARSPGLQRSRAPPSPETPCSSPVARAGKLEPVPSSRAWGNCVSRIDYASNGHLCPSETSSMTSAKCVGAVCRKEGMGRLIRTCHMHSACNLPSMEWCNLKTGLPNCLIMPPLPHVLSAFGAACIRSMECPWARFATLKLA